MSVRRKISISVASNLVVYVFQLVTTAVASRLLTPHEVGEYAIAFSIVLVLQALRDFGVPTYLIKEREIDAEKVQTVFGVSIVLSWGIALFLQLLKGNIAAAYHQPGLEHLISILSFGFIFFPIGLPASSLMLRELQFARLAIIALLSSFASMALSIVLLALNFSSISLAYGTVCGSILTSMLSLALWPKHVWLKPSFKFWRNVFSFGFVSSLSVVITQIAASTPELVTGRVLSLSDAALISRSKVLPLVLDRVITSPLQAAMTPVFASAIREGKDLKVAVDRILQYVSIVGWFALAFIAVNATDVVNLLYGDQWKGVPILLQAFCLNQAILMLNCVAFSMYAATGAVAIKLRTDIILFVTTFAVCSTVSTSGVALLAWMLPACSALATLLHFGFCLKTTNVSVSRIWITIRQSMTTIAILIVFGLGINLWNLIPGGDSGLKIQIASLALKGVFWAIGLLFLLWIQKHFLFSEAVGFIRKFMRISAQ